MAKTAAFTVEETEIRFYSVGNDDYICLTDMAKQGSTRPEQVIQNWLRGRSTIEFLGFGKNCQILRSTTSNSR